MTSDRDALVAAEHAFNLAMVSNDTAKIEQCVTPDWVLVTPERGPIAGQQVLTAIRTGVLSHDMMTKQVEHVWVMGDVASVTGRGQNTGMFRNEPIAADEWITDIYHRVDGKWRCVLTHLSPALECET